MTRLQTSLHLPQARRNSVGNRIIVRHGRRYLQCLVQNSYYQHGNGYGADLDEDPVHGLKGGVNFDPTLSYLFANVVIKVKHLP